MNSQPIGAERWRRIKSIFDRLMESDPAIRPALLISECDGDDELRAEVESLIASDADAGSRLERSPVAALVEISPPPARARGTATFSFTVTAPSVPAHTTWSGRWCRIPPHISAI